MDDRLLPHAGPGRRREQNLINARRERRRRREGMRAGQVENENRAILIRRRQRVNYNAAFAYFLNPDSKFLNPDLNPSQR